MTIPSRIRDFVHELRIHALYRRHLREVMQCVPVSQRFKTWRAYIALVETRSPAQVKRMERARGLG